MKKIIALISVVLFTFGCSEKIEKDWVTGSWKITKLDLNVPEHLKDAAQEAENFSKKLTYTFNADSTFQVEITGQETELGNWTIENDTTIAMYYNAIDNKSKVEKRNTKKIDQNTMRWLDNKKKDITVYFELTRQN